MARLGIKYFTRGKVMIGVTAESFNRPLQPFNPYIDNVDELELVKRCEGCKMKQAEELMKAMSDYFLNQPAARWVELGHFVDLADSRKLRIIKEPA